MSAYGPALFILRNDKKPIEKKEQALLLEIVRQSCRAAGLADDQGNSVNPVFYDYNGYEKDAVSFLIYSSSTYSMMPEDAQLDQQQADEMEIQKVQSEVAAKFPNTYSFKCYYVEN